ncbi:MAG: alcohol dehydrogenase catalytic domain-containing protein [Verrucomicrobia bacterium]|nr:alcohol dehydrogenase catalytic domain-containing protein [Verrucomicrobiota bacterium]
MRAILNTGKDQLEWAELPLPVPKDGEARLRTSVCGICSSDLEMMAGWSRGRFPQVLGHE